MVQTVQKGIYNFGNSCKHFWKKYRTPLLVLSLLLLLSISSILRANFKYVDDIGRTVNGYRGWSNFSRYLSSFLSIFLHGDAYLTDISPLPQILAIFIMTIASVILLHLFSNGKKITFWNIIAIIPLTINPYFLECLSYKYDAPYMAISILTSIAPFLFYKKNKTLFGITSFVGLLIMCLTYQASSGVYLLIIIFYALFLYKENTKIKEITSFIIQSLLLYLGSLLIYKIFFMQTVTDYVTNTIFPLLELPFGFLENLQTYYQLLIEDFKIEWLILIIILLIGFLIFSTKQSKRNKPTTCLLTILSIFLGLMLSFGIYPAFTSPLFSPRAMYGFGVFVSLVMVQISNFKQCYILKIISLALCWCFFVFSFTYGNALSEQKDYTEYRMYLVANDLNNLEVMNTSQIKQVKIIGNIGKSPVIQNMPQDYQILNRLVPSTFGDGDVWSSAYFFSYFNMKYVTISTDDSLLNLNLPILKDTMYHEIKGDDTHIIITLK